MRARALESSRGTSLCLRLAALLPKLHRVHLRMSVICPEVLSIGAGEESLQLGNVVISLYHGHECPMLKPCGCLTDSMAGLTGLTG
ncbi:hypothetical protein BU23DRAFT_85697 [Bimuria novae-zelandiae CBS 107.79]|uniref:Uncharacterized protein n=1 Tax=Bimuria novae-zelandiae CBS 107.79 TaxID=1447943 RepID=A0A6A5VNV4_9PLEO|nr:hypothetical protein BU23DRAFT_85697 [Bimuria novae-zelandiae CBS 107.79]